MTNYMSRFIPNYSTIAEPLCALTKKEVKWKWSRHEQSAFDTLKNKIIAEKTLAYFSQDAATELIVDGSPVGLGAILVQNNRPIAYGSRALTTVERRYSQTEREALAIVWGVEHFHIYLFGSSFTIITDHKPMEMILNNPYSKQPARIERWNLRLSQYQFHTQYRPGKDNPADYLSRNPYANKLSDEIAEGYIKFITNNALPRALTLSEVQSATSVDATLRAVREGIETGRWPEGEAVNLADLRVFQKLAHDLTTLTDPEDPERFVILNDKKLVIPRSLQRQVVKLAHEGHQGIVKTKQCLRQKVWFNGANQMVEEECRNCIPCQAATPAGSSYNEIQETTLPISKWDQLCIDFTGPFPNGLYLLVVIDEYSRYPIVKPVRSTSARSTIERLDEMFAMFGIPSVIKSDNGPPFQSQEFCKFCQHLGIKHRKITPYWPQANGEAKRFMQTLNKAVRTAVVENKDWRTELNKFLRNYRATPHTSTKIAPSEALMGKVIKTKLPELIKQEENSEIILNDQIAKEKMKQNLKIKPKPNDICIGDSVLVKQKKENKLTTPYSPQPMIVTDIKGSMITAKKGGKRMTRNHSHFKRLNTDPSVIELPEKDFNEESEEEKLRAENAEEGPKNTKSTNILTPCLETTGEPIRRSTRTPKPVIMKDFVPK